MLRIAGAALVLVLSSNVATALSDDSLLKAHTSLLARRTSMRRALSPTTTATTTAPTLSPSTRSNPSQPGLTQSWSGVYGASTLDPEAASSSATEAHSSSSANGNGIGLMPMLKGEDKNQAPLRPIGLNFHIDATMKVHDPIARDALLPYKPDPRVQPKLRFDIVERNNTILFYGSDDIKETNDDLVRLGNSMDVLTVNYYDALCYCRYETNQEFLTCRCEHSEDPWAPPTIPDHVKRKTHTHHDKIQELLSSSMEDAEMNGNYKMIRKSER